MEKIMKYYVVFLGVIWGVVPAGFYLARLNPGKSITAKVVVEAMVKQCFAAGGRGLYRKNLLRALN